jgi:drug/metabolite transporter (DMT)-like permease
MTPDVQRRGYVMVAAASSLWGCSVLFLRTAERMQPIAAAMEAFVVFAVTVAVLGPGAWMDGRGRRRSLGAWATMGALGLADAANILCYFGALQRTSVAVAVLTHYLAPVLVAVAEPLVLGARPRRSPWPAVAVSIPGLALLAEPWRTETRALWTGGALGLASAVFYATNIVISKRLQSEFSAREIQAWHVVPGVLLLPFLLPPGGMAVRMAPLGVLVGGSLIFGVLGGWLFLRGLRRVPASHASVLCLLEPVVAVLVGAVMWREIPGPFGAAGAALVLLGAWLAMR